MTHIVTETDSDGDLVEAVGPFENQKLAMTWLRLRAEKFARKWEDDIGAKVKIEWHPSGAFVHADCDPQTFSIIALRKPEAT